ncbi:MAG: HD domain-containing protein [Hyphomicrobiales bacterium]
MTEDDLTGLHHWFSNYVAGFYTGDAELDRVYALKESHTARVCMTIRRLGKALELSSEELWLTEAAGLLHDVGRFPQYSRYRTFRDKDSEDHGRLGLRLINHHGLLARLSSAERRRIAQAVTYHNDAHLPALADAAALFLLKLLRDADKLDIWKVVIGHYRGRGQTRKAVIEFTPSGNGHCSPAVLAALRGSRVVPIDEIRSECDAKLLYISWVFDLNFPASFRETLRGRYVDRLAASLPLSPEVRTAVELARDHAIRSAG